MNKEEIKKNKAAKIWHPQQEVILKTWGEQSACYRYMHHKAFHKFKKMSMRFTLPIIIISTVTGTANFAQETFPESWKSLAPAVIGTANLLSAILTTILQFLKVNELMESHRVSSIQFGKLSRIIRLQLTLPIYERNQDGAEFVDYSWNEYDRLIEQSPSIPRKIIKNFHSDFPESNVVSRPGFFAQKKSYDIFRPEIIDIKPIIPYDSIEEYDGAKKAIESFKRRQSLQQQPALPVVNHSPRKKILSELLSLKRKNIVEEKVSALNYKPEQEQEEIQIEIPEVKDEEHEEEQKSFNDIKKSFENNI
jgi:hypothetical protein